MVVVPVQCKDLIDWLFVEPNPIGVNTMMMQVSGRAQLTPHAWPAALCGWLLTTWVTIPLQLGICQPVFRLPYCQVSTLTSYPAARSCTPWSDSLT